MQDTKKVAGELLVELEKKGVTFETVDGKLKYKDSKGNFTENSKEKVKKYKEEIIEILKKKQTIDEFITDNDYETNVYPLSTWKLGNVAESYTTSMAGGGNRVISGIIGMVPVTFIVNTNVDRNDIDHPLHLYHRIELTFSTGRLCLVNTHGPVIWLPFLHMPRDEYGTLSINVEEEVNIPSGVTIGNVMLPSVKETFEQIWPDAVKKALEILFKQNRTEKMSMAQYQIYVSKLWSEICQKVGYMNIVDYDNFGDIKSIFYDLEKRHLIKKENDGIE